VSKESSWSQFPEEKKKEPTHLEFNGESYDQISEQWSDLQRIRESAFSGFVVGVWLRFLHLFKLLNVVE